MQPWSDTNPTLFVKWAWVVAWSGRLILMISEILAHVNHIHYSVPSTEFSEVIQVLDLNVISMLTVPVTTVSAILVSILPNTNYLLHIWGILSIVDTNISWFSCKKTSNSRFLNFCHKMFVNCSEICENTVNRCSWFIRMFYLLSFKLERLHYFPLNKSKLFQLYNKYYTVNGLSFDFCYCN
jgi:hypothetical protein